MAGYFEKFPFVTRTYNGTSINGMNITRRTGILDSIKNDSKYYMTYHIQDGETPEILSERLYDTVEYSWTILMMNDIFDVFEEWPMSYNDLMDYIDAKYTNINEVHHYESVSTGLIVDSDHLSYDIIPVTNLEYEVDRNDKLRDIKLLTPDYISTLINQHNELVSSI